MIPGEAKPGMLVEVKPFSGLRYGDDRVMWTGRRPWLALVISVAQRGANRDGVPFADKVVVVTRDQIYGVYSDDVNVVQRAQVMKYRQR